MATKLQYLTKNDKIVNSDGTPTDYLLRLLQGKDGLSLSLQDEVDTILAALPDKADKSTQIITGTGLTGGGDLSADRTLVIDTATEAERIRDVIGAALVAGANITITVDDPGDTITIAASGGGGGGGRSPANLGTLVALSSFTQINLTGTRSATEVAGKAITVTETLFDTTLRITGLTRPVPASTPYRVAAFVQPNFLPQQFNGLFWGWSDGTKFELFGWNTGQLEYDQWSNSTTRVTATTLTSSNMPAVIPSTGFWIGMRDDGTNVYFETSADGVNFAVHRKAAKSAGYLGSSGYTKVAIHGMFYDNSAGIDATSVASYTILDWDDAGLSRSFS